MSRSSLGNLNRTDSAAYSSNRQNSLVTASMRGRRTLRLMTSLDASTGSIRAVFMFEFLS